MKKATMAALVCRWNTLKLMFRVFIMITFVCLSGIFYSTLKSSNDHFRFVSPVLPIKKSLPRRMDDSPNLLSNEKSQLISGFSPQVQRNVFLHEKLKVFEKHSKTNHFNENQVKTKDFNENHSKTTDFYKNQFKTSDFNENKFKTKNFNENRSKSEDSNKDQFRKDSVKSYSDPEHSINNHSNFEDSKRDPDFSSLTQNNALTQNPEYVVHQIPKETEIPNLPGFPPLFLTNYSSQNEEKSIQENFSNGRIHGLVPSFQPEFKALNEMSVSQYFANHVSVEVTLVNSYVAQQSLPRINIKLINNGRRHLSGKDWSIYFNSLPALSVISSRDPIAIISLSNATNLVNKDFSIFHVDGGLFKIAPVKGFIGIAPNQTVEMNFRGDSLWYPHFICPRWYVVGSDNKGHMIKNTDDDELNFVTTITEEYDFLTRSMKASSRGKLSAEKRFEMYNILNMNKAPLRILPTPVQSNLVESNAIEVIPSFWVICGMVQEFQNEVNILNDFFMFKISTLASYACPISTQYFLIRFVKNRVSETSEEAYRLVISKEKPSIDIIAENPSGAFYAVQSLISLAEHTRMNHMYRIPVGIVTDWPRFSHRGLFIDVARNFIKAEEVIKIIKTMSLYKLNKLQLHLTDDEAWRLEIDGLPELTSVGAFRRHSEDERDSIIPLLGSGPYGNASGSGFYSKTEYQKILRAAKAHHVQVIPEIDVPGHSRAAIKAMESRFHSLMEQGYPEKANQFLVSDMTYTPVAQPFDYYRANAMNPCMNSTYRFLDHVVGAVKRLHASIQPLQILHIGTDEVAIDRWESSPLCKKLLSQNQTFPDNPAELQELFFRTLGEICTQKHGINIGVWGDGISKKKEPKELFSPKFGKQEVISYDWTGSADDRLLMIESGYKLVMAEATHFYFDHPVEPDIDEPGLRWAGKSVDDLTVFRFNPRSILPTVVSDPAFAELEKNIYGIQAQVWSELLYDVKWFHHQLFPRLIALAERAWHKADWEYTVHTGEVARLMMEDWTEFANVVGYKELPRLKRRNIAYRIPPPGAIIKNNQLFFTTLYPGLTIKCRTLTDGSDWSICLNGQPVTGDSLQLYATDNSRKSKVVELGNQAQTPRLSVNDTIALFKRALNT